MHLLDPMSPQMCGWPWNQELWQDAICCLDLEGLAKGPESVLLLQTMLRIQWKYIGLLSISVIWKRQEQHLWPATGGEGGRRRELALCDRGFTSTVGHWHFVTEFFELTPTEGTATVIFTPSGDPPVVHSLSTLTHHGWTSYILFQEYT